MIKIIPCPTCAGPRQLDGTCYRCHRFVSSPEQAPPTCGNLAITNNRCELPAGHRGQCRFTYPNGAEEHWVRRDYEVESEDAEELFL